MFFGFKRIFKYGKAHDSYQLVKMLKGHGAAINTLAFNSAGTLLASGGDDEEVRLWDLAKGQQCQTLVDLNHRWGQITRIAFLYPDGSYMGGEKMLDFQQISSTRVSSPGDSVEHFFESGNLVQLWGEELSETIPRAVIFVDKGKTLVTFAMESRNVVDKDAETAAQKSTRVLSSCIGGMSVCPTTGNYIVDNMKTGFDVYTPNRTAPTRSFYVANTRKFVKQGVFSERGKIAVCGSDHGNAYIFGMNSAEPQQVLRHGKKIEMIQAVERRRGGKYEVCIWEKALQNGSALRERHQTVSLMTILNILFIIVLSWMTADTWLPPVADKISSIAMQASHMLDVHDNGQPSMPEDVQKILAEMDEETLRKVLQIK
ncbi:hypothetical protein NLJ89_g9654 [Agrocybe chaxingu]|uniref:Uncharacterized protein n=1 Tax=Agrocybe chaxingu TaxID=84603 RepID=A0A9W8MR03_9AGAR|nr:hypothetical protein NLJ89_g9654 [Agrocybe chaxingu]